MTTQRMSHNDVKVSHKQEQTREKEYQTWNCYQRRYVNNYHLFTRRSMNKTRWSCVSFSILFPTGLGMPMKAHQSMKTGTTIPTRKKSIFFSLDGSTAIFLS